MKIWIPVIALGIVAGLSGCNKENERLNAVTIVESQFQTSTENWIGGFSEFSSKTDTASLDTAIGRSRMPIAIDSTRYGLRIQGHNRSDDMFMFFKKKVIGLIPNRSYRITFQVDFGTQFAQTSVGSGGSPGISTYLKAGASSNEPVVTLKDGKYNININKGNQSESGTEMVVIGNASNGIDSTLYRLVAHSSNSSPLTIKANANGVIWLCVGTDSGFEGLSIFYYDRIKATLIEQISE